eukprot:scaffold2215_cov162-Amphora_coffeaeformis.AAC.7
MLMKIVLVWFIVLQATVAAFAGHPRRHPLYLNVCVNDASQVVSGKVRRQSPRNFGSGSHAKIIAIAYGSGNE